MTHLIQYVLDHTERGECQCGQCIDKGEDRPAPLHSVDVHFFWVSLKGEADANELLRLLEAEYPRMDRLRGGPSYIEIGQQLGDQQIALRLIGLGALLNLWPVITPKTFGFDESDAPKMAGHGLVMAGGMRSANAGEPLPANESQEER